MWTPSKVSTISTHQHEYQKEGDGKTYETWNPISLAMGTKTSRMASWVAMYLHENAKEDGFPLHLQVGQKCNGAMLQVVGWRKPNLMFNLEDKIFETIQK